MSRNNLRIFESFNCKENGLTGEITCTKIFNGSSIFTNGVTLSSVLPFRPLRTPPQPLPIFADGAQPSRPSLYSVLKASHTPSHSEWLLSRPSPGSIYLAPQLSFVRLKASIDHFFGAECNSTSCASHCFRHSQRKVAVHSLCTSR